MEIEIFKEENRYNSSIYTIYYNKAEKSFFCLDSLISETTSLLYIILFAFANPVVLEDYKIFNITLKPLGTKQKEINHKEH